MLHDFTDTNKDSRYGGKGEYHVTAAAFIR